MFVIILAVIFGLIFVGAVITAFLSDYKVGAIGTAIFSFIAALVVILVGSWYSNGVGEAKVVVDAVNRNVLRVIDTPQAGFHSPLEDFVEFDLFSNPLTYAGPPGNPPEYARGDIKGAEVTVAVGGIGGGSAQANVDTQAVYNLDSDSVVDIYNQFKTQERFTQMIIEKEYLDTFRQVPANYTTIEFRGTKRAEAAQTVQDTLNENLARYGVTFSSVTIQDIRYSTEVENALRAVEVANQEKEAAKAQAQAQVTKAQGEADAKIAQARGDAEATRLAAQAEADANIAIAKSLTSEVLQSRYIEALRAAGEHGSIIVTDGKSPVVVSK